MAATDDQLDYSEEAQQSSPTITRTIARNPVIPSAPANLPTDDAAAEYARPDRALPQQPGPLSPPPRVAPQPPLQLTGDRQQNQVARAFRAQDNYQEKLGRYTAGEMYDRQQSLLKQQRAEDATARATAGQTYDAQQQEKVVMNREQRELLKNQGVQTQENPETGIVEPARDESGKIQFRAGTTPEDKQIATDTELHAAGSNAMGQHIYDAARNLKNTVQDVTAKSATLADLTETYQNFDKQNPAINETHGTPLWASLAGVAGRTGPTPTAQELQKQKSDLRAQIMEMQNAGIDPDPEISLKGSEQVKAAREAHTSARDEQEAWSKVSPKRGGDIDQLIMDRTNDVLAAGNDPAKDHVLSAIEDRRKELGVPAPTPEDEALKADPVYGPAITKAREQIANGQAQIAPLQARTNKILSRLESIVGMQTNPAAQDQGDPDSRLGLLRAFTDHLTDPEKRGRVLARLAALDPTLAQLRQNKEALQPILNAHDALQSEWRQKFTPDAPEAERKAYIARVEAKTASAQGESPPPAAPVDTPQQPSSGPINPQDFETKLSPQDEAGFQTWKAQNAPNDSGTDYDLRGAFKAGVAPDANGHWPDTFKKPNHPTFSDQSVYAKDRPDLAGHWNGDSFVQQPPKYDTKATGEIKETPTVMGEFKAGRFGDAAEMAYESVRRQFSGLLGPTSKEKSEEKIAWGKNPDGSIRYEYRPLGNRMEREQGLMTSPFVSEATMLHPDAKDSQLAKLGKAVYNSTAGLVGTLASPGTAILGLVGAGSSVLAKVASGAFGIDMAAHMPEAWQAVKEADKTPAGSQERIEAGLNLITQLVFTHSALKHAITKGEGGAPPPSQLTPEAAHAEINSLQPSEKVAPEQVEQTQHVLRGLVKISQGEPIDVLTAAERTALLKKDENGIARVEMVRGEDGKQKPVITDGTLQRARSIAPETSKLLPADEHSQRQAILAPQVEQTEPATGKQIDLSGMGKGVIDNLYDTLWNKLQKGDLIEGGKPSGLLQRARDEMQAGTITNQQELRDWAQSGGQLSPVAKRVKVLSKTLQINGVDTQTAAAFASKFVGDRGTDEEAYAQRTAVKEAFTSAGGKFTETGERDPTVDQANQALREKIRRVEPEARAYGTGNGKKETGAASKPGGAPVDGETRGVRATGENRESAPARESAQKAEQTATRLELAGRTHVDDSIDAAFEQRKVDFRRAGINKITETNEPFGATGFREKPDGSRELLVNRKVAREWFDKFGPEKARELIGKGFEEEAKHAIERRVARDNGTDTAALYRDWAKQNPDQEKILASAYGKEWANYSDTGKSAELTRMILQTRATGKTTEQLHLGPERAAAVDRALKQFKEPVRLTERLRQHLSNVLEYLRGIKNPSKAILDHIKDVERFENELKTSESSSTLAMARPDAANSARDREQARIDGAKLPMQRLKDAMPLAQRIASGYRNIPGVDVKDVEQHARIALARASKTFDSSRGVPFEAFARVAINNELRGLYRKQSRIAEQTTLDEPFSGETNETRASQLPDEAGRSPADESAHNEGVRVLHEAIDALPAKMRTVMTRLAAGDDPGAIARDLGIAKQGVSNLKIAALRRLRGKFGEHGITGVDDDGIVRMAKPEPQEITVPTGDTPEEKRTFKRAATRLVPGLNVAKDIKTGIQSLFLPTAQSPEHVRAAVDLGRPLGEMHHRQEVSAFELKPDWKAFEKLGVHREDVPLTENPGIKFMSDMSQGRKMTDSALQSVADRIDAMFIERLDHLEKAGAPIESVRENYFPGMWTRESREAFNQAMGEFREAGRLPDDLDLNAASAELKTAIKARADELLEKGQGSSKDMLSYLVRTPMKGRESFRKGKVFDDIMTAVEFGLRPISNNPADLVMGKLAEMDKSIMANQAFRTWERKGQLVAFDNSGRPMKQDLRRNFNRDEWAQINDKYGTIWHRNEETGMLEKVGERWATKPVADIVNNYLSSSLYNNRYLGKLYTGWMATANALNQSQLGWGSAFHAGFTTMEAQVSAGANLLKDVYSVMRGTRSFGDLAHTAKEYPTAFAKTAMTGDKVLNAWRDPDGVIDPRIAQIVRATELAGAGFKLERGMKTEQSAKVVSDWFSGNKVRAAIRSPIAFTELLAKPIMEKLVPRQKAGVFAHLAWRIIEQNPGKALEDLAPEFRDAWNRVDARLGQVRYDRLFANNTAKNVVQALIRAPGWTGGTIAELGGAFKDSATFLKQWHQTGSLPKDVPDRVAYSLSLLVTAAAMNGALTYAFTGTAPQGKDFLAFRDGGVDEAGNPTRMILPSYMKDIWAYATHPLDTLLHKSHPLLSIFGDLIQNKDYYGVQVRDPEANALTQALQSGLHVVKAFTPFWIRGVMQAKTPTAKALPLIGVMPAPKSMTATPAQELAYELHKRQYEGLTKTHAEADKTKLHSELIKSARSGDTLSVRQAVVDGKITRSEAQRLLSDARLTPFQSTVHKLPLEQALRVFDKGTPSEKEELRPVLQKRNEEAHKRGDIPADEYFENKAKLAGSTKPQAGRPVLHTKPVMPRPQPNHVESQKKVSGVNLVKEWKRAA